MLHSQTVEYAMRAIVFLGARHGQAYNARAIAEGTAVPPPYMAKVLQDLVQATLLQSRRGRHGGFELAALPSNITLLDVINAVAPLERIHTCPMGRPEHEISLCPLHARLDANIARTEADLATCTIAELLSASASQAPYCGFPGSRPTKGGINEAAKAVAPP